MGDQAAPTTPAEFIRRELDARGLAQTDLAFILGVPQQAVNQIATGKRGVSAEMAKALGQVFGVSSEFILKLQKDSEIEPELSRARSPDPSVARKAKLVTTYPIREMVKRGWLLPDASAMESEVARFFGVSSVDDIPRLAHAARKANYNGPIPETQLAWLFRVRQIAKRALPTGTYSEAALRAALVELRRLTTTAEGLARVPRILSGCGVRFVLVEGLPGGKIDGVCFWLNQGASPVVGMSVRHDRIDNFWFVLRHELEHVLRRHGVDEVVIDADLDEPAAEPGAIPEEERLANAAASDFCVPKSKMDSWIARKAPFFSEDDLLGFSKVNQVHPGIVAGQLRHRLKKYHLFTKFNAKVRQAITKSAIVDGWGEIYPTNG